MDHAEEFSISGNAIERYEVHFRILRDKDQCYSPSCSHQSLRVRDLAQKAVDLGRADCVEGRAWKPLGGGFCSQQSKT